MKLLIHTCSRYCLVILLCFSAHTKGIASDFLQTSDSLKIMIGQMIMIGLGDFTHEEHNDNIMRDINDGLVGGVVIYEKNLTPKKTEKQLVKLINSLQRASPTRLFVSIDEEGGRVSRLKPKYGFESTVTAQYLGTLDNLDTTQWYARKMAKQLNQLGINMNYTPNVDVNINPTNPVIGKLERSYSENPQKVVGHATRVIKEHRNNEVITVLKHFPGHGSSDKDTHLGLTDITNSWQMQEVLPYRYLLDSNLVDVVMIAHIIHQSLDHQQLPATLSKAIITDFLRNVLSYDGVVITDDMQMGAIKNEYGLEEAIERTINAGADILMFANNVRSGEQVSARQIHHIIYEKVKNGKIAVGRIRKSYKRIIRLKKDYKLVN